MLRYMINIRMETKLVFYQKKEFHLIQNEILGMNFLQGILDFALIQKRAISQNNVVLLETEFLSSTLLK